jgi:cytochrome P450
MFAAPFERPAVDALRQFMEGSAHDLVDSMERARKFGGHKGPFDLHEAFSLPLAFSVIYKILGIHPEARGG